ncbi:MAG: BlaI/MecI/CopY family transcriptional regulator [Fimbriimonadaceae bacterium]|nr:BlaI/MecI/CopY family transcriptional regulator [Fimbriimonadaceae bacterium]
MNERKDLPALSEVQLEIMNVLWTLEEATLGDIWAELSARRPVARNTVQTLLTRLVDKGWVLYRQDGKSFVYRSAREKGAARRQILGRVLDAAFQGSAEGLMMTLLEDRSITAEEADRLRSLIDEAERQEP